MRGETGRRTDRDAKAAHRECVRRMLCARPRTVKPLAGTDWCEAPHFQYHISGTLRVQMSDGTEFDAVAGDVTALPQGHDAWVVGDEPVVVVDWWGASNYARS